MMIEDAQVEISPPRPLDLAQASLFLDLDGTLAPFAERPGDVRPDPRRTALLRRLAGALDGRLAVLSGRELADLDRILDAAVRPAAGVHGLVRRDADGTVHRAQPHPGLAAARETFGQMAAGAPGLLVEDKGLSIALHYRMAPQYAGVVREAAAALASRTGLALQAGALVCELRTPGPDKGDCLRAFMAAPPFHGFRPVFVGDDLTDEDGFAAAAALGGLGVLVGPPRPTKALRRLPNVEAALAWLEAAR